MLDEPAGELGPLVRVATIDGQTRLSILVLGILQVTGYFLVYTKVKSGSPFGMLAYHTSCLNWTQNLFFCNCVSFYVEADLDDGSKVLSTNVILCLQV